MAYYQPNQKLAYEAAAKLNAEMPNESMYAAAGRPTSKYVVDKYAQPKGQYRDAGGRFEYGVVRRWIYGDRPDLGEFGGGFEDVRP